MLNIKQQKRLQSPALYHLTRPRNMGASLWVHPYGFYPLESRVPVTCSGIHSTGTETGVQAQVLP
jgi:hypothetical protein